MIQLEVLAADYATAVVARNGFKICEIIQSSALIVV
jgi:hypothetical protein